MNFSSYDHVTWYVSNALQASEFYISKMGFRPVAYMGLETGSPDICGRAVASGAITMVFISALRAKASVAANTARVQEIHDHVALHGDGVKDVAFSVDNVRAVFDVAVQAGAQPLTQPTTIEDEFGTIETAAVKAYGDTTHTLINRTSYKGVFMPGYRAASPQQLAVNAGINQALGQVPLAAIDHCVANQGWDEMDAVCEYYEKAFGFHKFWSPDDNIISTEYSALNTCVMASDNERVKVPINEPAKGLKVSQVEEFHDFYSGAGVQHIALCTTDILTAIETMQNRGLEFITIPASYYEQLAKRLGKSRVEVTQDLKEIQRLNILVDFDESGYLLQLFTKPLVDRPTVFFEIIQRHNFEGFGAGNFKALFESIERDQAERGTL